MHRIKTNLTVLKDLNGAFFPSPRDLIGPQNRTFDGTSTNIHLIGKCIKRKMFLTQFHQGSSLNFSCHFPRNRHDYRDEGCMQQVDFFEVTRLYANHFS